ncbi:MAG: rhomboid family intramembrane serine protease [Bdellovibrionales bacterium]|nr:rhomboid family intramembrane serine protease [Bdellovibrionales bacterium]
MDLNYILLWIVAVSCLLHIYRFSSLRNQIAKNVILLCVIILSIEFLAFIISPLIAGYLAFAAWFFLLILPALIRRYNADKQLNQNTQGKKTSKLTIVNLMISLNVLAYLASEILGGSTNPQVLVFLGGLIPELAYQYGQWWRLLTATFLHFGLLHIFMNCFALYILGPFVEKIIGKARFLLVYLFSGLVSMGLITFLNYFGLHESHLVIGASGSVMGVVGATAGIYFHLWLKTRALSSTEQLKNIGIILLLQAIFDLSTPQVSFTAHFGGVLAGFILSYLLIVSRSTR